MKRLFTFAAVALVACACASTPQQITGIAPDASGIRITNSTVVTDLQSASYNFDNAVAVGALPANDPAPACLHDVLVKAGIEIPAGAVAAKSFVPKNDGIASAGAIAYILAQQAKQVAAKGIVVDPTCEALVGRVVIDGVKNVNTGAAAILSAGVLKGLP